MDDSAISEIEFSGVSIRLPHDSSLIDIPDRIDRSAECQWNASLVPAAEAFLSRASIPWYDSISPNSNAMITSVHLQEW
ncbi:MAG: hypothetical protein FJ308_01510 [Planctomycetes bacterium]|nr:hypothetical protein [Planctomycetota bacterium]